jgi:hypothetical protein
MIETEIDSDGTVSPKEKENTDQDDFTTATGEYVIRLQNETATLATFSDTNQSNVMAEATNYLIENHDLISELEPLPYVPGNKNAMINNKPVHPDGEREMRTYRELADGYYLFTSLNKSAKKRHVQWFADKCRLSVTFDGEW